MDAHEPARQEHTVVDRSEAATIKVPEMDLRESAKEVSSVKPNEYPEQMADKLPNARPEVILDRVEKAAERDLPIEKLYEQQHEAKEASPGASRSSFASGATGLPDRGSSFVYSSRSKDLDHFAGSRSTSPPTVRSDVGTDMYRQAMKSGFWTAIGLMLLLGVLVLIY